jgi:hypothetical protein
MIHRAAASAAQVAVCDHRTINGATAKAVKVLRTI